MDLALLSQGALVLAADKSGVGPKAISLPSGPGSIEGLGESFEPTLNTGTAKYGLGFTVPPGPAGRSPSIGLAYEGGRGNGPVGFGWGLDVPYIQRQTDKGIPRYVDVANGIDDDLDGLFDEADELDTIINSGGEELVPTGQYYFCENESAFVRYERIPGSCSGTPVQTCVSDTECPVGETCAGMHWEGTLPDGTLQEYGLTTEGQVTDETSRRVFKWLLQRSTDTNGNTTIYRYRAFDGITELDPSRRERNLNQKYLSSIEYGPGAAPWAHHHFLLFEYEDRSDWFEDARSSFLVRTGMRLKRAVVGTRSADLDLAAKGHALVDFNQDGAVDAGSFLNRRYELVYGGDPHWSLLTSVTLVGADGVSTLPPMVLSYTTAPIPTDISAMAGRCSVTAQSCSSDPQCPGGEVCILGTLGSANTPAKVMDDPYVDLIDMNADGLPDILRTDGVSHTAYLNRGQVGSELVWSDGIEVRGDERAWNFNLQSSSGALVQLTDQDGDGLADFTYRTSSGGPEIYYFPNGGAECAGSSELCWNTRVQMALDPFQSPPSPFGADPDVKTADVDFDKRIDVIRSEPAGGGVDYQVWFNRGGSDFTARQTIPQGDGEGFLLAASGVQIVDWNGDRVPDVVRVRPSQIEVTVGLGYGAFAPKRIVVLPDVTLTDPEVARAKLEDVTGDGLVDLVVERPVPNELWYWINLGNDSLALRRRILDLPSQANATAEIRWADMDGNGTTDLVYADAGNSPTLQTIDIGQIIGSDPSPHLLTRIGNGIGRVVHIEYATTTRYLLADEMAGRPWPPLPFPVDVISTVAVDDSMGHRYFTEYTYHDGYYDAGEKEFRGFGAVEKREVGDGAVSNPTGGVTAPDQVMAFRFDTGRTEEARKGKTLQVEARDGRADPGDAAVYYRESSIWATRELYAGADGDLRKVTFPFEQARRRDVIEQGSGTLVQLAWDYEWDNFGNRTTQLEHGRLDPGWGDERLTKTTYTADFPSGKGAWVLRSIVEQTICSPDACGPAQGQWVSNQRRYYDQSLILGSVTRGNLTREEDWTSGNHYVISVRSDYDSYGNIVASYDPLYPTKPGHRRSVDYDARFHVYPVHETIYTGGPVVTELTFAATYDEGLGVMATATDSNAVTAAYEHDTFARLVAVTRPPDTQHTTEFGYVLAHQLDDGRVVNWVETRKRDDSPGDGYLHTRGYVDGLGRSLMTRMEGEEPGQIVVTHAVEFNDRRSVQRSYLPYFDGGSLDYANPIPSSPFSEHMYDAMGREIRTNQPTIAGALTFRETLYQPLSMILRDENQTAPGSEHFGSEKEFVNDGLLDDKGNGRLRLVYEVAKISDTGEPVPQPATWLTQYGYDPLDNLTSIVDSQGNQTTYAFDGLSRKVGWSDPDRGLTTYTHDAASNVIETVDAKQQHISFEYDGVNRLVSEDYHDELSASSFNRSPDVEYVYDASEEPIDLGDGMHGTPRNTRGYLVTVRDLSGAEHTSYDARGRVEWTVKKIDNRVSGPAGSYRTILAYDSMDRLTSLVYPDKESIGYGYNARGLLEQITGGPLGKVIDRMEYAASGHKARCDYASGVTSFYEYDERFRLVCLQTSSGGTNVGDIDACDQPISGSNAPLLWYKYFFDGASVMRRIEDRRPGTDVPEGDKRRNTQLFRYDDLYRLNGVSFSFAAPGGAATDDGSIAYRYDRLGNMLEQTSSIVDVDPVTNLSLTNLGSLTYGGTAGPHAVTAIIGGPSNRTYTYDPNGNMTSLDGVGLSWDFKDRLVGATGRGDRLESVYDYTDRRIVKSVTSDVTPGGQLLPASRNLYVNQHFEVRDGQPVKYVFDGPTRVARLTGTWGTGDRVQRIWLYAGWNLVGLAISASGGLGSDSAIAAIYRWDESLAAFVPMAANAPVEAGSVLWIQASAPTSLVLTGPPAGSVSIPVGQQGQFVANSSLDPLALGAVALVDTSQAWTFDDAAQRWRATFSGLEFLSEGPPTVASGRAFYVKPAVDAALELPKMAERIVFYHQDHLGSSNCLADGHGVLVEEAEFYPFGLSRAELAAPPVRALTPESYLFLQKEVDRSTGLQYFDARYLAAELGRFASPDPLLAMPHDSLLRDPQARNAYSYAANNPVNRTDSGGLWSTEIHNEIIGKAFPGLSDKQRQILMDASKAADSLLPGQLTAMNHEHAMRSPFEDADMAKAKIDATIGGHESAARNVQGKIAKSASGLEDEALEKFGAAFHVVSDRTSPAHTDAEGKPKKWWGEKNILFTAIDYLFSHGPEEEEISPELMNATVVQVQESFRRTFGTAAAREATQAPADEE